MDRTVVSHRLGGQSGRAGGARKDPAPPSQGLPEYVAQPEGDAHPSPVCGKEQHF